MAEHIPSAKRRGGSSVRRHGSVVIVVVVVAVLFVASVVVVGRSLAIREHLSSQRGESVILTQQAGQPATCSNSLGMQMVWVPAGEFVMGSAALEQFIDADERAHRVRISKPFYLGMYEVTVGQFRQFVEATGYQTDAEQNAGQSLGFSRSELQFDLGPYTWRDPGFPQSDNHPVVLVSWNDAAEFCRWLSRKEKKTYRLPTEAEWEWACRAGTTTRFSSGDEESTLLEVANIHTVQPKADDSSLAWGEGFLFTLPVGSFRPNRFGLYDMHGNVQEWCADWYERGYYAQSPRTDPLGPKTGDQRAVRGGSYHVMPWHARSANRSGGTPSYRYHDLGFRVACDEL